MNNKLFKMALAAGFVLALAFAFSGCGDDSTALVGKWTYESGIRDSKKPERYFELFKDGTGICDDISINWKIVDNKRFVLSTSFIAITADYKISGSELTITYDEGGRAVFVKKK